MANFTALKTAINNAIKTNGNEEITGAVLQVILDAMVETLGDSAITNLENALAFEVTNRENAVGSVANDLTAEAEARAALDYQVNNRINQEEYNRQNADAALSQTMSQGFSTLGSQMNALSQAISALNAAYQNGFLYGGVVTPSSSPANGKCFYIALQGGTYTNFGGVGVVQGINILKNDNGWKVEHIYDQTTLLNEFYLLRQQVIQAITSFAPIVIEGDVTNAPDEEDLTSNAQHLLQFKNNAYSPLEFSGLGRKYLRKNIAPLSESAAFNGFVEGVTAEETLSGTPEYIFWDRMNTLFVGIKDGVYYADWSNSDNYVPASTSLVYMYQGTPYKWDGSDFSVDETEVPNLVNCLTQDMINEANTIYIIRYDYTLKEDITIPANCVLQFDGGSISGEHTITGANTVIKAGLVKIFNTDVTLAGTWINNDWSVEWFGCDTTRQDNQTVLNYAISQIQAIGGGCFVFNSKKYKFNDSIVLKKGVSLKGEFAPNGYYGYGTILEFYNGSNNGKYWAIDSDINWKQDGTGEATNARPPYNRFFVGLNAEDADERTGKEFAIKNLTLCVGNNQSVYGGLRGLRQQYGFIENIEIVDFVIGFYFASAWDLSLNMLNADVKWCGGIFGTECTEVSVGTLHVIRRDEEFVIDSEDNIFNEVSAYCFSNESLNWSKGLFLWSSNIAFNVLTIERFENMLTNYTSYIVASLLYAEYIRKNFFYSRGGETRITSVVGSNYTNRTSEDSFYFDYRAGGTIEIKTWYGQLIGSIYRTTSGSLIAPYDGVNNKNQYLDLNQALINSRLEDLVTYATADNNDGGLDIGAISTYANKPVLLVRLLLLLANKFPALKNLHTIKIMGNTNNSGGYRNLSGFNGKIIPNGDDVTWSSPSLRILDGDVEFDGFAFNGYMQFTIKDGVILRLKNCSFTAGGGSAWLLIFDASTKNCKIYLDSTSAGITKLFHSSFYNLSNDIPVYVDGVLKNPSIVPTYPSADDLKYYGGGMSFVCQDTGIKYIRVDSTTFKKVELQSV